MQDIANELGVSAATVSNALTGRGRVSPALRDRIRATALAMEYRPSPQARALRTGRSGVIGLVLPDLSNPLFPAIAQAVESAAAAAGFGVLIADSRGDTGTQTDALRRLERQGADGIVLVPRRGTRLMAMDLPVAVIDTASTPGNTAASDHRGGGALAVAHLADLGHRHLLFLGESRQSLVQSDRIAGMRAALTPQMQAETLWLEDGGDIAATRATGIIATSDLHALTALTTLHRSGRRVPDDVSVIGFDDHAFGRAITPALTTVAQDTQAIAGAAIASLAAQLGGAPAPHERIFPMTLTRRGSTAPAPNPNTET
nr:LacI family DNA-binding transcriptional regulator [Oceaniglobus trochenteri]